MHLCGALASFVRANKAKPKGAAFHPWVHLAWDRYTRWHGDTASGMTTDEAYARLYGDKRETAVPSKTNLLIWSARSFVPSHINVTFSKPVGSRPAGSGSCVQRVRGQRCVSGW